MIVVDTIFVQQGGYGSCLSRTIRSSRSSRRSAHFIGNIGIAPPPRDPGFHPEPTSCPPLCRVPRFAFHVSRQLPRCCAVTFVPVNQRLLAATFARQLRRCCAVTFVPAAVVSLIGNFARGFWAGPGDDLSRRRAGRGANANERATWKVERGTEAVSGSSPVLCRNRRSPLDRSSTRV